MSQNCHIGMLIRKEDADMGREVRRVPKNWKHPEKDGNYIALLEGYAEDCAEFDAIVDEKERERMGNRPAKEDYMPDWPESEKTHLQMYETCTEGTPISPVMETPEELARWLADNGASSFGRMTATYQQWLCTIKQGGVPSCFFSLSGDIESGVEHCQKRQDSVMIGKPYLKCSCGSETFNRVKCEPVQIGRYTDHVVTYQCTACGKTQTVGKEKLRI